MNKIPIPRVESRAPNKNTIEWEIPSKVKVVFMLTEKIGYTIIANVKVEKKHWWNRSFKTFTVSSANPAEAIMKGLDFVEKYGYHIDHNTIQFGEKIGLKVESRINDIKNKVIEPIINKRSETSIIEFRTEEIKDRTEWLFWRYFVKTENTLDNLRPVFQTDDYTWKKIRPQALYETILWSLGNSIAVLRGVWNRKLSEDIILKPA